MAISRARINSIFRTFGIDPAAHAAKNGETLDVMYARMETQHDQDTLTRSLLRAYPEQGTQFVTGLFDNRGLDIATSTETEDERVARIVGEISGGRTFTDLQRSLDRLANPPKPPSQTGGTEPSTIRVLGSSSLQWSYDKDKNRWFASYKLPNSNRRVFFEATSSQMDAIFGSGKRPTSYQNSSFETLTKSQTFSGDIMEMSGEGTFEAEVQRVTALALDEGILPKWAQDDPAVMDIIYVAASENKSTEWVIEQISKLSSFKTRFPGIETYKSMGLSTEDAVTGWLEVEGAIKENMVRQGINPSSLSNEVVGDIIKRGHSVTDIQFVYDSFERFNSNASALAAFNEVLAEHGLDPLSAEDQMAFLEGNAPAELYRLWEEASFNQAANDAGLNIGVKDAIELASATEGFTNYDEAYAGLSKAAVSLLRFRGDLNAGRYGLDSEDLIDLAIGIAPRSGRSAAEIGNGMERALSAARAGIDGPRAQRFRQYGKEGQPQAVSTSRARAQE